MENQSLKKIPMEFRLIMALVFTVLTGGMLTIIWPDMPGIPHAVHFSDTVPYAIWIYEGTLVAVYALLTIWLWRTTVFIRPQKAAIA
jgi:hypothetical protein